MSLQVKFNLQQNKENTFFIITNKKTYFQHQCSSIVCGLLEILCEKNEMSFLIFKINFQSTTYTARSTD